MKTVKLKTKNHGTVAMGIEEFSGWAALIEAMEIIDKNSSNVSISANTIKSSVISDFVDRKRRKIRDRIARDFYTEAS